MNGTINPMFERDMDKVPQATREENDRLARLARDGDEDARALLIASNMRFVIHLARKKWREAKDIGIHLDIDDVIGDGALGLSQCVDTFDPDRGVSLLVYARRAIIWSIDRNKDMGSCLSVPCGHYMSDGVSGLRYAAMRQRGMSLDAESVGHGGRIHDVLPSKQPPPDEEAIDSSNAELVDELIGGLTEIEAEVIRRSYGIGDRREELRNEIAVDHGYSPGSIAVVRRRALKKMWGVLEGKIRRGER